MTTIRESLEPGIIRYIRAEEIKRIDLQGETRFISFGRPSPPELVEHPFEVNFQWEPTGTVTMVWVQQTPYGPFGVFTSGSQRLRDALEVRFLELQDPFLPPQGPLAVV